MSTRRGFLGSILAAGMAPAAIGSGILMPVRKIIAPPQGLASVIEGDLLIRGSLVYADDRDTISDRWLNVRINGTTYHTPLFFS